jgi:hypothetical protein
LCCRSAPLSVFDLLTGASVDRQAFKLKLEPSLVVPSIEAVQFGAVPLTVGERSFEGERW